MDPHRQEGDGTAIFLVFCDRGTSEEFPPPLATNPRGEQHDNLVKLLQDAKFRLTDKGEVEVFCGMQFQRIGDFQTRSRRSHRARIKIHSRQTPRQR
eukprot:g72259.t1